MGIAGSLLVFAIAWMLAFQALLPFGVKSHLEDNSVVPGTDPGAPTIPGLRRKAIYASIIAVAVWAVLFWIIEYRVVTIDDLPSWTRPSG